MTAEDGHDLLSVIIQLIGLIEGGEKTATREVLIETAFKLEQVLHNEILIAINKAVNAG